MSKSEIENLLQSATKIGFNINIPSISLYFPDKEHESIFEAMMGEYFDNKKSVANLDIRDVNNIQIIIYDATTGDEFVSSKLEICDEESYKRFVGKEHLRNGEVVLISGTVSFPSNACIESFGLIKEIPFRLSKLNII